MSGEIEFELEVGLEYDLSPIIGNKLISQILAAGGEFFIDGNTVVITALPGKEEGPPPAVIVEAPAPAPEPEPTPEPEPEPVKEEPVVEEEAAPEFIPAPAPAPAPKTRARKVTPDTVED